MMVRGNFAQLMAPGLHSLFVQWTDLSQRELEYPHVFHEETSSQAFEDEVEFAGLGPMVKKPEGESVAYVDGLQGGTLRYQHFTYALGCRMSFELFEDDQYKLINQVPKALSRSAIFTREQVAWNVLNLGFTTQTTIDGLSLFNTAHPLLGGPAATTVGPGLTAYVAAAGTFPNRPTVDVDLSFVAIQVAINEFERLIDGQGLPIMVKPRHLIIPPELKFIAREILGSPNKPYTSDNEINSLIREDLDFFICHYLTSRSAWFLLSDKDSHRIKFFTRQALDEDYADDFDTRSLKTIAWERYSVGATVWYGTWGSNGP
jgi:hypothetical protein